MSEAEPADVNEEDRKDSWLPDRCESLIQQCDVPVERHETLRKYRAFRARWLEQILDVELSFRAQLVSLAWYSTLFRVLNESRAHQRPEQWNNLVWRLAAGGYAQLIAAGVRRLIDNSNGVVSIRKFLKDLSNNMPLMTREMYVCHDGFPFDPVDARHRWCVDGDTNVCPPSSGPTAWEQSLGLHGCFDQLQGAHPEHVRKREDRLPRRIVQRLESELNEPVFKRLENWANKRMLHVAKLQETELVETPGHEDVAEAIRRLGSVLNFISSNLLLGGRLSEVVPLPSFDWEEGLLTPWIDVKHMPTLRADFERFRRDLDQSMRSFGDEFLPARQSQDGAAS